MRRNLQPQQLTLPSGYRVLYRDWGEGLPVVFLHGLLGNHRHWLGVMKKLKQRYRCIAIDLLGFGDSSQPRGECGVAEEVAFVREVVRALDIDGYVFVGHSLGGWVAVAYALDYQDEMAGMVLAAPAGLCDRSFNRHYLYRLPLTWNSFWFDWGLSCGSWLERKTCQSDHLSAVLMERKALLEQPTARQFVRSRALGTSADSSIQPDLHRIRLPTLIVAAEKDTLIPLWQCRQFADKIPQAQLQVLPNTSHRLPIEHWKELLQVIQSYLEQYRL